MLDAPTVDLDLPDRLSVFIVSLDVGYAAAPDLFPCEQDCPAAADATRLRRTLMSSDATRSVAAAHRFLDSLSDLGPGRRVPITRFNLTARLVSFRNMFRFKGRRDARTRLVPCVE